MIIHSISMLGKRPTNEDQHEIIQNLANFWEYLRKNGDFWESLRKNKEI